MSRRRVPIGRKPIHQHIAKQRSDDCSAVVHRAVKTKGQAALFESDCVGNHRVARRGTDSLTHTISHTDSQYLMPVPGEGKERARKICQPITGYHERLTFAETIAEVSGKKLQEAGDRFSGTLDQADG